MQDHLNAAYMHHPTAQYHKRTHFPICTHYFFFKSH